MCFTKGVGPLSHEQCLLLFGGFVPWAEGHTHHSPPPWHWPGAACQEQLSASVLMPSRCSLCPVALHWNRSATEDVSWQCNK